MITEQIIHKYDISVTLWPYIGLRTNHKMAKYIGSTLISFKY